MDRGAYICKSQSLNVGPQLPTLGQLTSRRRATRLAYLYCLGTRPAAQAIQFTVDQSLAPRWSTFVSRREISYTHGWRKSPRTPNKRRTQPPTARCGSEVDTKASRTCMPGLCMMHQHQQHWYQWLAHRMCLAPSSWTQQAKTMSWNSWYGVLCGEEYLGEYCVPGRSNYFQVHRKNSNSKNGRACVLYNNRERQYFL